MRGKRLSASYAAIANDVTNLVAADFNGDRNVDLARLAEENPYRRFFRKGDCAVITAG